MPLHPPGLLGFRIPHPGPKRLEAQGFAISLKPHSQIPENMLGRLALQDVCCSELDALGP